MSYATEARLLASAAPARVRAFTSLLAQYGGLSRVEWQRHAVVVELPEDAVAWIVTGGFAELLDEFEDCLRWWPDFREQSPCRAAGLPPPRPEA